jgi:hypothetical protein
MENGHAEPSRPSVGKSAARQRESSIDEAGEEFCTASHTPS